MDLRRALKYLAIAIAAFIGLVVVGFLLGFFGVPEVDSIENEFGTVNNSTTEVNTDITVRNPNPIGVSLGGLTIDYVVNMNEVEMASGTKEGIAIDSGKSSIQLRTYLQNGQIPEWWYTHVSNGEQTTVNINADVSHSTFGGTTVQQNKSIETDILSAFNSTQQRPVDANAPAISDPVLYINETQGTYADNVTRQQTPLDMQFTMYNPKVFPYVVTRVGYDIYMNNISVGNGTTDRNTAIPPRGTQAITAETVIENDKLDQWWVSHVKNKQQTELYVDMYMVIKPNRERVPLDRAPAIRLDSDELDYRTTIETDIFGSKEDGASDTGGSADGGDTQTATPTPEDDTLPTGDESTAAPDDGTLPVDGDSTATPDDGLLS